MYAVVTGVAGFIGSHLAEALVAASHQVMGIDCFTDAYDPAIKHANMKDLIGRPEFEFVQADLRVADLVDVVDGAEVIFHLAGQPGVRGSFGRGFVDYCDNNIVATERLLEAAQAARVGRFVFASSSSVYGNAPAYPTTEEDLPRPFSPYGVTKLAAEHLCAVYAQNWGLPTVSLRYFSVYGPRQRPDMAIHRLIVAARHETPFQLYGDGGQVRDFTYVTDVVEANLAAAAADLAPGSVANIAGGSSVTMLEIIDLVAELTGRAVPLDKLSVTAGDVYRTGGSNEVARALFGWEPTVTLRQGLQAQLSATVSDPPSGMRRSNSPSVT
jgi:nucleoside-diphosphate-sugar epimerase